MINLLPKALKLVNEVEAMKYKLRKGITQSPNYEVRFTYEGKEYTRSTRTANRKEADKKAREIISEVIAAKNYPTTLGSKSLNQAIESRANEMSKNEINNVERVRLLKPSLFNVPMATISGDDLWELKKKYSKRTNRKGEPIKGQSINRAFKFIYSTFTFAKKQKWILETIEPRDWKVSPPIPRKALSNEHIEMVKDTCIKLDDEDLWDILSTYLNTGLRREELHGLKREHVVYDGEAILLPDQKNGVFNQELWINDSARETINKHLRKHNREHVFDFTNFRKRYERVFSEAELKTDIHSLRHTAITNIAIACESLVELQTFSRHKSLTALQQYLHLTNKENNRRTANLINYR